MRSNRRVPTVGVAVLIVTLAFSAATVGVVASTGGPLTADETGVQSLNATPEEVTTFEVGDRSTTGWWSYATLDVEWAVETDDPVEVTVRNLDTGSTVATYEGANGTETYDSYGEYGDSFAIELQEQGDGSGICKRYVGTADGTDDFTIEDCSENTVPDIGLESADLSTGTATVGESVTVTATYANDGTAEGTETATLSVDGQQIDEREVTVAPNETTTVTFEYTFDSPGEYEIAVDDATAGVVDVTDGNEGPGIGSLSVTDRSEESGFIGIDETILDVEWAVDGDVETVTVTVENKRTGGSETYTGASGNVTYNETGRFDDPMVVTVEATGADGTDLCERVLGYGNTADDFVRTDCVEDGAADLAVTDLSASEREVSVDDTVTVTATVDNAGTAYESTTVAFENDVSNSTPTEDVYVLPGWNRTASTELTFDEPGTYTVTAGDESVTVEVSRPDRADIRVIDADMETGGTVSIGESVPVTATVKNVGSASGTIDLNLTGDEEVRETRSVSVDAADRRTVTIPTTFETPRSTSVQLEVNDKTAGFVQPIGPEVSYEEHYDLLPSNDSAIEYRVTFDLSETQSRFEVALEEQTSAAGAADTPPDVVIDNETTYETLLQESSTVTGTDGIEPVGDGRFVANASTTEATIVLQKEIDEDQRSSGITDEWAFFPGFDPEVVTHELDRNAVTGSPAVAAPTELVFVGEHERRTVEAGGDRIDLVVADDANLEQTADEQADLLKAVAADLDVGSRGEYVGYGVPSAVEGPNGLALGNEKFWYKAAPSTLVHEYVHMRQNTSSEARTSWRTEAIAETYESYYQFRYGELTYDEFRTYETGAPVDLTDREAWTGFPPSPYSHGSDVVKELDSRIRAATDGERTFEDLFRLLNDDVPLDEAYEQLTGESIDEVRATYIEGDTRPAYDRNPGKYEFTDTERVSGTVETDGGIVFSDANEGYSSLNTASGFDVTTPHNETGLVDSRTTFDSIHTYQRIDSGSWELDVVSGIDDGRLGEHPDQYAIGYLQTDSGDGRFPRDGVPDLDLIGQATPNAGGASIEGLGTDPEPVTVRVVDENGEPVEGAAVDVSVEGNVTGNEHYVGIADETGADGRFAPGETAGLELADPFVAEVEVEDGLDERLLLQPQRTWTPDRPISVQYVVYESDDPVTYHGSVAQKTATVGESVTVTGVYEGSDETDQNTVPVYVDGQQVDTVTHEVGTGTETFDVDVSFETAGEHEVRIGDLPARTITVEDDGSGGDAPTIDEFAIDDRSTAGSYWNPGEARFDAAWSVRNAEDVTVTVANLDRNVERASYGGASGTETYVDAGGYYDDEYGEQFRVRLTAVGADGTERCTQLIGPADGTDNFEQSDC